jgi:hAT family C-terminal dimerisation region
MRYKLYLYKVANKYLGIIATSVPSERLFSDSDARNIMRPERNQLSDVNLNNLVFHGVPEELFFKRKM